MSTAVIEQWANPRMIVRLKAYVSLRSDGMITNLLCSLIDYDSITLVKLVSLWVSFELEQRSCLSTCHWLQLVFIND